MRVVFMGTPQIAADCLSRLIADGFDLVGVYTKPDMPKNRGMKLAMSEVKEVALAAGLPVYQPATFRDDAAVEELRALRPDVIAVVAYGKILPQRVLDIPKLGCINIHTSILPALRGSAPAQWAILNGLDETGVTAMYLSAGMDEGDIIEIRKTPIELSDTLHAIEAGTATRTPQDPSKATLAPMLSKELSPIDWTKSVRHIVDQVRGLDPWPVATADLNGTHFKIYGAQPTPGHTDKAPGTPVALTKQGLTVACGNGELVLLTQLQAPGGKRMAAPDYFRGHPIEL